MVACAPLLEEQPRYSDEEHDYFWCHRELSRHGRIPGVRLDGDEMTFLLHLLSKGPGYAAFRVNTARRFGRQPRTVSSWHAKLRAITIGGVPLLATYVAAGLNRPMPWDRARRPTRHPNLHGYRVAARELRALLEQAIDDERRERIRSDIARAQARAAARASAPLPAPKPAEGPAPSSQDVDAVRAAWNALDLPTGKSGRGQVVDVPEERTIVARLRAGWTLDVLLAVVAGAGVDPFLRAGRARNPFAYAFAAFGGGMERLAAAGRVALATGAKRPTSPPSDVRTSLQDPARTLVVGSHAVKHGSLKTATAGSGENGAPSRARAAESGTAPAAPSSHHAATRREDGPPAAGNLVASRPPAPAASRSPSGPEPPRPARELGGRGEQSARHARSEPPSSRAGDVVSLLERLHPELRRPRR
jgi:hypothetical protein